jgi:hypothetical protein
MSKEKLWELYLRKNPALNSDRITFTATGLKKFFLTTYDEAYKQGYNQEPDTDTQPYEEYDDFVRSPNMNGAGLDELLGIFGMKR